MTNADFNSNATPGNKNEQSIDFATLKDKTVELFQEKYAEALGQSKRPNILICGYTGSGKTSLARAVLGDLVDQERIGSGRPVTMGYEEYQNEFIRIWDSKGLEPGIAEDAFVHESKQFLRERQQDANLDNHIHLVWYTIQGPGARVTDCDIRLMKDVFPTNDVIVVITKKDLIRPSQYEAMVREVMTAGIAREHILTTIADPEVGLEGCQELVDLSCKMLPDAYRDAFINAQKADLETKLAQLVEKGRKADTVIKTVALAAAGIGLVPIPLSDATLLVPTQMGMVASLATIYGLEKKMVAALALPFVGQCAGYLTATSLTKLIPGIGSLINGSVAGGLTWAMGMFLKNNFEEIATKTIRGEDVSEIVFSIDKFKKYYEDYKNKKNAIDVDPV